MCPLIELGSGTSGPQGPEGPAGTQDTFLTVVPTAGDNIVSDAPNESLTITSNDGSLVITGDNTAKSLDISLSTNIPKISISSNTDEIQLLVNGNPSQSSPYLSVGSVDNGPTLEVFSDGRIAVLDAITAGGSITGSNLSGTNTGDQAAPFVQEAFVNKGGNDTTADGSQLLPFLTIKAALASISDASSSKFYCVNIGPGTYSEATDFTLKDYVSLKGAGRNLTKISRSNASTIVYNAPAGFTAADFQGPVQMSISDLEFSNGFTIQRPTSGVTALENFTFGIYRCIIRGAFTWNGAGNYNIWAGADNIDAWDSIFIGAVTLNNVATNTNGTVSNCRFLSTTLVKDLGSMPQAFSTITAVDSGLGTITVSAGANFVPTGTGQYVATYGGTFHAFVYTSYDSVTGVFSGCQPSDNLTTVPNGTLPSVGDKISNYSAVETRFINCTHNRITSQSVASDSGASSCKVVSAGGFLIGQNFIINGVNAFVQGDASGLIANSFTFQNSATIAVNLILKSTAALVKPAAPVASSWAGSVVPTTVDEAINRIALLVKTLNGGTGP